MILRRSIGVIPARITSVLRMDRHSHVIPASIRVYSTGDKSSSPEFNASESGLFQLKASMDSSQHSNPDISRNSTTSSSQQSTRPVETPHSPVSEPPRPPRPPRKSIFKMGRKKRQAIRSHFDPKKMRVPHGMRLIDGKLHFRRTERKTPGQPKTTEWISLEEEARLRTSTGGFGRKEVYM